MWFLSKKKGRKIKENLGPLYKDSLCLSKKIQGHQN